mmetsp:Transcript_24344/g.68361  ORF Transcript_24344/g.68361 Transcript_24344/m.68361 type:complete len:469 (-) Transcript_24344:69-1475(-)
MVWSAASNSRTRMKSHHAAASMGRSGLARNSSSGVSQCLAGSEQDARGASLRRPPSCDSAPNAGLNGTLRRPPSCDSGVAPPATPPAHRSSSAPGGPRALVGAATLPNFGKGGENQDSYVASSNSSGSKCLVGVFDGHGEKGRIISEFARSAIPKYLFGNRDLHADPLAAFENAFHETQRQIERLRGADAQQSGTTAVAAYQHRDRLFVANVGDSRAVLGRCDTAQEGGATGSRRGTPTTALRAIELSSDQKPGRADERRRILDRGGVVKQSAYPVRQGIGAPRLVPMGPERVWDSTGRCGLCVSRSLGDLGMRPFVTAAPEVSERQLGPQDRLLVLGSDGVWDHIGSQEAVNIAAQHRDPAAAAREITDVARQRWHTATQGQLSDDITAVVVHLDRRQAQQPQQDPHSAAPLPPQLPGVGSDLAMTQPRSREGLRRTQQRLPALEQTRPVSKDRQRLPTGLVTAGRR